MALNFGMSSLFKPTFEDTDVPVGPYNLPDTRMNWLGPWSAATDYVLHDVVQNNGAAYACILAHTNQEPANAVYWNLLSNDTIKITTTTTPGNPSGTFEIGDMVVNSGDNKIYVWSTVAVTTPDVLWLKLEDNGTDSSGAGNTATASGGAYGTGKYDRGYVFDGDDATLTVGDSTDFDLDGNFTIEMWVNLDLTAAIRYLFNRKEDGSNLYNAYIVNNGAVYFYIKDATGTDVIQTTPGVITADTWHHVAITGNRTTNTAIIYVDGNLVGYGSLTESPVFAGADDDLIFGEDDTQGFPIDGTLDDIKIWTRVRTQGEVRFDMKDSTVENLIWTYIPLQTT